MASPKAAPEEIRSARIGEKLAALRRAHDAETRAAAAKAREHRLKRRVAAGTCPCCQRTVAQLARHMQTKHPDYGKTDNVVALKA